MRRTQHAGIGVRKPPGATTDAEGRVYSNLKHVAEKRNGEWKILVSQNTFTPPTK